MFVMENVKGILTMKHDKDLLLAEEKVLAEEYYEVEKIKIELAKETKKFSNQKRNFNKGTDDAYSELEHKKHQTNVEKNRKELKKLDKNVDKFRISVPEKIVMSFQEIGYQVKFKMLNSADYGVPQRRERVIFIGVETQTNIPIIYPNPTHHKEGTDGFKKWVSVREAIDDLKDAAHNEDFSHIYTKHSPEQILKIKNTPIGKSVNPKYTEACFRCYPDLPSGTVKENHGGVFVHYEKDRVMTPRELARLQSFPDDFIFKGKKNSILVQLGNAVPCGLSQAIAKSIRQSFNSD
jgi:DNA-cytosine methyltransferase